MSTPIRRNLPFTEVEENKEDVTLVWLDENIDDSPSSLQTQIRLKNMNNYCQFYTSKDLCFEFMRTIKHEKILFVVPKVLAHNILPQLDSFRSIMAVFITCPDYQDHMSLPDQYSKRVKIYSDENSLLESIAKMLRHISKQTLNFNPFDQRQRSIIDLSKDSASFLWYQLLTNVLRRMPQNDQAKQQMVDICLDYYQGNERVLESIRQFQMNYTPLDAISWYTADSFVYRLLNKALRIGDIELLHAFRLFIIDLCTQLELGHQALKDRGEGTLILFRGQQISNEEFEKLQQSIGILISTN